MRDIALLFILSGCFGSAWAADDPVTESTDEAASSTMTEDELEAELQRIEETVNDEDEVKEFVPSKPLAADLPIALPSDL